MFHLYRSLADLCEIRFDFQDRSANEISPNERRVFIRLSSSLEVVNAWLATLGVDCRYAKTTVYEYAKALVYTDEVEPDVVFLPHGRQMKRRGVWILLSHERRRKHMSSEQSSQPTFLSVAPRFVVHDMEQALAFYGQLGFQTTYHDEHFAIVERDRVDLHLNYYADPPKGHAVCWIAITNSEVLYQQYLTTNAVQSVLEAKPWGLKEFFIRDPFGNLILFAERIPEADANSEQEG